MKLSLPHLFINFIKSKMKLELTTHAVFQTLIFQLFAFAQPNLHYLTRNKIDQ